MPCVGAVLGNRLALKAKRPEGEVGEVVVTTFNRDYPMIRFGTGDLSAVLSGASPCGRTNMRIKGWLGRLDKAGVPSGAIRTVGEVCEGEVLKARDMVAEMPHPSAGTVKAIKSAMHLSDTPLDTYVAPPKLGQHTREVLTGLLGYTAKEVDALAKAKVI